MPEVELVGNERSPYVRRVRIVALELGVDIGWVDTDRQSGSERLHELNPLWKVPVARLDGELVLESGHICRELLRRYGPGALAPHRDDDLLAHSLVTVIDGALDALLNVAYLERDGVDREQIPYLRKQRARAENALRWLDRRAPLWVHQGLPFGLVDVALVTALDALTSRHAYPVTNHPQLLAWAALHAGRESVRGTASLLFPDPHDPPHGSRRTNRS